MVKDRKAWHAGVHGITRSRTWLSDWTGFMVAFYSLFMFLTVWITVNCERFLKRWDFQTTLLDSWEICMQVEKQQLEPDMEQWTGSKLGKEYVKAVYFHAAYLTYMQKTSCKMPDWMKQKLESRFPGEISITSDMQMIPPRKWRRTKEPLDESERGEWKIWLKTQYPKN